MSGPGRIYVSRRRFNRHKGYFGPVPFDTRFSNCNSHANIEVLISFSLAVFSVIHLFIYLFNSFSCLHHPIFISPNLHLWRCAQAYRLELNIFLLPFHFTLSIYYHYILILHLLFSFTCCAPSPCNGVIIFLSSFDLIKKNFHHSKINKNKK